MPAKIEFSKTVNSEMKRTASNEEISHIIQKFIKKTGWDIIELIKLLLDGKADSISIMKDRPRIHLFLRKNSFEPKISFDMEMGYEKEIKIEVPIKDIDKVFKS